MALRLNYASSVVHKGSSAGWRPSAAFAIRVEALSGSNLYVLVLHILTERRASCHTGLVASCRREDVGIREYPLTLFVWPCSQPTRPTDCATGWPLVWSLMVAYVYIKVWGRFVRSTGDALTFIVLLERAKLTAASHAFNAIAQVQVCAHSYLTRSVLVELQHSAPFLHSES